MSSDFKLLASKFKPRFRAKYLGPFCNDNRRESTELNFVKKFEPFKSEVFKLMDNSKNKSGLVDRKPVKINKKHLSQIKEELQANLSGGSFAFNDKLLYRKVANNGLDLNNGFDHMIEEEEVEEEEETPANASKMNKDEATKRIVIEFDSDDEENIAKHGIERYNKTLSNVISRERGKMFEKPLIEQLNKEEGWNFCKDSRLKQKDYDGLFSISGFVDGIDTERNWLIEIKTKDKLEENSPNMITLNERLQCICYMNMTGCSKCILVESGPSSYRRITEIDYNENEFEEKILKKLNEFVLKYRQMSLHDFKNKWSIRNNSTKKNSMRKCLTI